VQTLLLKGWLAIQPITLKYVFALLCNIMSIKIQLGLSFSALKS